MTRQNIEPETSAATFVHESAQFYGKITLNEGVSVWPNVVARAEAYEIVVGAYSNIQDFTMIHVGSHTGTYIGDYCSITHHCTIHGATIGDNCLIGINATVMDGAVIGENSIVGGHTIVPEGKEFPANSVITGVPGKLRREQNNFVANHINALMYHKNGEAFAGGFHRIWDDPDVMAEMQAERVRLQALLEAGEI